MPRSLSNIRLALVHDWLTGLRGGEKCLDVLCQRFPNAPLITLLHRRGSTTPAIERMNIKASWLNRVPAIERHYRWWLPLMPLAVESLPIPASTELVVSFSHAVAKGVIAPRGVPHVSYCFTPMRYAWDLREDYFGQPARRRWSPLAAARNVALDRIRDWDRDAAERVSHFIAISQTIADRIQRCYGRASTIIFPPADTDYYTPDDTVARGDDYLVVSALVPYKRIDLAIAACSQTNRRLTIIGAGPERARLEKLAGPSVRFLGWQSDEVIRDHLRSCRALLFPGHEDFGIVPVEAQACGAPVIALARGGATETVLPADDSTTGTGVFFDTPSTDALVASMEWLESRPERLDPDLARRQAERFAASRYEQQMLDFLANVVEGRSVEVATVATSQPLAV